MAELQVLAGACWVVLSAQGMLHLLDFQFQGVQGAKNLLHAISIVHVVVSIAIIQQLAGINVPPGPLGSLDGQGLDDFSRRTLIFGEKKETKTQLLIPLEKDTKDGQSSNIPKYTLDMENSRGWC